MRKPMFEGEVVYVNGGRCRAQMYQGELVWFWSRV